MRLIASYLYWIFFFVTSAFFCSVAAVCCMVTAPLDPNRRLVHKIASVWGYSYLWCNPFWRCKFTGLENIEPNLTYVLVANHQSFWDIMLLYGIRRHFKWVSKESILKIPFIGWNMKLNQYVSVSRMERRSVKEMLEACRKWLKLGSSIMIFPEGTRSLDGNLGDFRDGPFKLACECDVPVVPIVIDGTFEIMPKGSVALNFCTDLHVTVLPAIAPSRFEHNARSMRLHVRELMADTLSAMRKGNKKRPQCNLPNTGVGFSTSPAERSQ